ncbi:MAG: RagB/SusD family nutrient uptake outer membrane protein [Salinivirgaceae bacterium]|nr:RagB/SusD family nutrient uptake outer membrane protein [Salinivirgaceae bacterium]
MKIKSIVSLMVLIPAFVACDDVFEPMLENQKDFDTFMSKPENAQGLMLNGYNNLPYVTNAASMSDVATDDAVTNDYNNGFWKIANGNWSAKSDNPFDRWSAARKNIQYVNQFLQGVDGFYFNQDPVVNAMCKEFLTGEAHALRGFQLFYFLRTYAGMVNGTLMGVPNLLKPEQPTDDFNVSRATFAECIEQIFSDFDQAFEMLPYDYGSISLKDLDSPKYAKYVQMGVTNPSQYNDVFGDEKVGRISGRIVEALAAQVALYAASPAFSEQSGVTWKMAAERAAKVLDGNDGVAGLSATGATWYCNAKEIERFKNRGNPDEILWRENINHGASWESDLYPPSQYGKGKARVNPTQNLVDAFPMANGYPIKESGSGYNDQDPYANRDPRLDLYIVHDGSVFGPYDETINTTVDKSNNNDGLDISTEAPNRTGYYVRKYINEKAEPERRGGQKGMSGKDKYNARIRYTELYLAFAEAANEAYGPTTASPSGYSAYDVIKAIRKRGGIVNDEYLENVKSDKDKMRELIRNERRIELCFEGHRFWDLRRWKLDLNETVMAMKIETVGGKKKYTPVPVANETRAYSDYMYFGPLPESEILKWSNLLQNDGWN